MGPTKEHVNAIINYCAEVYDGKAARDEVIETTKAYVKDTTNLLGEHLTTIGDQLTAFVSEQLTTLETTRHRVALMSMRLQVMQAATGEAYDRTLVAARPRQVPPCVRAAFFSCRVFHLAALCP